jgi:hypothetical protein
MSHCIAIDPNAVPKIYESKLNASQDYTNPEKGGLSFKKDTPVYVLFCNDDDWCTGKNWLL